jgi:hypothetical protein
MKEKTAPEVHHNIIAAFPDTPILEFYKGYFECVYIILNPFMKCNDYKAFINKEHVYTKEELLKVTDSISWNDVVSLCKFKDIKQLDVALRNMIGGLNDQHRNDRDVAKLRHICESNNLIIPPEGNFSELLLDNMLSATMKLGHEWIYIGDEFGWVRKLEYIQDIIDNKVEVNFHHESWYTLKNEILYTTHWDSHFTLLCSNKETVKEILNWYPFEGFYCNEETEIYWSVRN